MRDIECFLSFVNVRFQPSDMHASFRIPQKIRKLLKSYGEGLSGDWREKAVVLSVKKK